MATKFILHGGYANDVNEKNDKFFREILNIEKEQIKVLLVYFAKDIEEYERVEREDLYQFRRNKGGKEVEFEIAEEERFAEQARTADVIYLHGGKTSKLLPALKNYENLSELFDSKVVAGESAGAYVLSTCFYSKTEEGVLKGLGFVPAKTICHYEDKNREKLEECSGQLEELLLPDFEYRIFEMDQF